MVQHVYSLHFIPYHHEKDILSAIAVALPLFAQQLGISPIYYNGGNVGIGTTSPGAKLEFDASSTTSFTRSLLLAPSLSDNNYTTIGFGQSNASGKNGELRFNLGTSRASYADSFVGLQNNGDVLGLGINIKKGGLSDQRYKHKKAS